MDLTAELHRRIAPPPTDPDRRARLSGVEHEFRVLDPDGRAPVDFRRLIGGLDLDGRRLDPGDPLAVRGRWGGVITADGPEAEIATPPVAVRPGFTGELVGWTATGAARLAGAVPDLRLEGYSTHVSVEVDDRHVVRTARRFTDRFAIAQMLLLDQRSSPGLLVRPRRQRLELCGDYVAGTQLRAASVFAVAATAASQRRKKLPPRMRPAVEPAKGRFGFYVDRRAFGPDLYTAGRATVLRPGLHAQDVLERSWEAVRAAAADTVSADELRIVDDVVEGRAPLPLEDAEAGRATDAVVPGRPPTGRAVEAPRRRSGGLMVEAVVATWAGTAFSVAAPDGRSAVVAVPQRLLEGFLSALDVGRLDDVLWSAVAAAPMLPLLSAAGQLADVGAFGGLGPVAGLVPSERDPLTGRIGGGRGRREDKDRPDERPRPRKVPRALVAAAAVLGALVLVAALAAALGGDDEPEQLVAGPGEVTTTVEEAITTSSPTTPAAAVDHATWRGWIAADSDYPVTTASRYYSRAWWVDASSSAYRVAWYQDEHHYFEPDPPADCQRTEGAGSGRGEGESQVSATSDMSADNPSYDAAPGLIFNAFGLDGEIPIVGVTVLCNGDRQPTGQQMAMSTFLNGFRIAAPLASVDAIPLTVSYTRSGVTYGAPEDVRTYVVCMTRSTTDGDGDGLPDMVDLDPDVAGPLEDLGRPGGPGGTPIPHRLEGGPDGIEGLPSCPAAADAVPGDGTLRTEPGGG